MASTSPVLRLTVAVFAAVLLLAIPAAAAKHRDLLETVGTYRTRSKAFFPRMPLQSLFKWVQGTRSSAAVDAFQDFASAPTSAPAPAEGPTSAPPPPSRDFPGLPPAFPSPPSADVSPPPPPSPDQPPLSTPPPPPAGPCPPVRSSLCDFYFQGAKDSVPEFSVSDGNGDVSISPPIEGEVRGTTIPILVANSEFAEYVCIDGESLISDAPSVSTPGVSSDNQFYASQDQIAARTFQPAMGGVQPYKGRYVRLNLTSVQLDVFNMVTNLNKGEGNNYFPEDRRCVLFRIAP